MVSLKFLLKDEQDIIVFLDDNSYVFNLILKST